MMKGGNRLKLKALTSGPIKTITHHTGHVTLGSEVQLEQFEIHWMQPLQMTYSHLLLLLFFFFLRAVSLTCLFIFGSRLRSSDHGGDCCISNGADREMTDAEVCILWLRRSHGRQR